MSHIFISYAHDDKPHLDQLVTWLREHKFADREIWYDTQLESGNNWRDEITAALNEAFVVLVIVTKTSVKSLYCTYEWAYAMGQGIPTLPMVFGELSITDIPAPLSSKQFVNCRESIPDYLQDQIKRLRSIPPQVAAINKIVHEAIFDTHRRFYILAWIGDGLDSLGDPDFPGTIIDYFSEEASNALGKLESLMLDKAFALSGKQYRYCWQIIDFLKEFSILRRKVEGYLQTELFTRFYTEWLPAFEYFEGDRFWRDWKYRFFEQDLEDEYARMEVFAELIRVFPDFNANDVDTLIHNKIVDQKRNQKG